MPLTFTTLPVPFRLRQDHERRGGTNLRRWAAYSWPQTPEVVRVLAGLEPLGEDPRRRLWHLSVSVANSAGAHVRPSRPPTDEEFNAACALIPQVCQWEEERTASLTRHGFQVDPQRRPAA